MNENLLKQFTEEDIAYAIKTMAPLKAPSIDGFPAIFFLRILSVEVICPLYKEGPGDSGHLMWSCRILQHVWASLQIKIAPSNCSSSCNTRYVNTFSAADKQQKNLFPFLSGPYVIARDYEGEIVGVETYLLENVVNVFVAEARACERALLFAMEMGHRRLILEGDSLSVIKKLRSTGEDKSILRLIINHIQFLETFFDDVHYLFMPRTVNIVAHTLALEGRRSHFLGRWVDGVPISVRTMVEKDRWRRFTESPEKVH
ncbi:hypothetical protein J1N35_029639 [Gossypium stocksii]|uniref:RNase H type-1 domain-containing protein n=1 Tax=Gossypium stocksii TaxID=47602 RepID=A0A9D3UY49_9ROSI|nr:hypothetical protein J1N35_029639 [Gossypium stocksii]